jgi:hypothetical protein
MHAAQKLRKVLLAESRQTRYDEKSNGGLTGQSGPEREPETGSMDLITLDIQDD